MQMSLVVMEYDVSDAKCGVDGLDGAAAVMEQKLICFH